MKWKQVSTAAPKGRDDITDLDIAPTTACSVWSAFLDGAVYSRSGGFGMKKYQHRTVGQVPE